jgi:hypothetical protein
VSEAKIERVNLIGATYEPASEAPDPYVAGSKGLATLNAPGGDVVGLVQLRKLLQDAGLSDDVRQITSSIQRAITKDQLSRDSPPLEKDRRRFAHCRLRLDNCLTKSRKNSHSSISGSKSFRKLNRAPVQRLHVGKIIGRSNITACAVACDGCSCDTM